MLSAFRVSLLLAVLGGLLLAGAPVQAGKANKFGVAATHRNTTREKAGKRNHAAPLTGDVHTARAAVK